MVIVTSPPVKYDDTTIGKNASQQLEVKDEGLSSAKLKFETGTVVIKSADTERTESSASYVKKKEISVSRGGVINVYHEMYSGIGSNVYTWVYKNGIATGTERITTSGSYVAYNENIAVDAGDLIQLYAKSAGGNCYMRNFRIRASASDVCVVNLD